jgi:hypothetical protein
MSTPTGLRRPPGRYDEPRPLTRPVLLGGAALLVAALMGFAFVAYQHYASTRVEFSDLGYQVSDTGVAVRFQVVKGAGKKVECVLQARDRNNVEVGSLVVTIGPEGSGAVTKSSFVPTSRPAVAGEVLSCRPVG